MLSDAAMIDRTITKRRIWCCGCDRKVSARLTVGEEIYPYREDLMELPFWICDGCDNYVGCHYKAPSDAHANRPLGCISTPEISLARVRIHEVFDTLWTKGHMTRSSAYKRLSEKLDIKRYHTSNIRSMAEADHVMDCVKEIVRQYSPHGE